MRKQIALFILLLLALTACTQTAGTAIPATRLPTSLPAVSATPDPPGYLAPQENSQPEPAGSYPDPQEAIQSNPYPEAQSAVMKPETRFGIPEVDRVLETLFHTPEQFPGLIAYTQIACVKNDAAAQPACAQDQSAGTPVALMPVTGPENRFLPKDDPILTAIPGKVDLLGVFRVVEGYQAAKNFPAGLFGIVLSEKETGATIVLRVNQDGIVRLDYPVQIPGKEQPDLEIYLMPQP
jgi:hypothetical protein